MGCMTKRELATVKVRVYPSISKRLKLEAEKKGVTSQL